MPLPRPRSYAGVSVRRGGVVIVDEAFDQPAVVGARLCRLRIHF
jgi:hypothetical protein